ncbi:olfactory receptor 4Q3-like [Tiliqua scincoides]|uniref:olfactory receptor 4Q3-like n=1 Tax=Tiliqua scincoides TaxID=71010 RepID=UPI003461C7D0
MNGTTVTEFVFLLFSCSRSTELLLLTVVMICYTTILLGNLLIVVTVRFEPKLFHCPMYFFLANLSVLDISLGSVAAPKLVKDLLNHSSSISYGGCMTQIFTFHFFAGSEMILLTVMAYDRYVAICHPLRYTTIMDRQRCLSLLIVSWTGAFAHGIFQTMVIDQLPFCGPNVLDNFFCDVPQVIKLACADIYVGEILLVFSDTLVILPCFVTLLISYATILATLCGRFGKGGRKALSTCGSHLTVVSLFYVPCVYVYLKPFSISQGDKIASVFYMVVTPALNPLIYTLRNEEVKGAMMKLKNKCKLLLLPQ